MAWKCVDASLSKLCRLYVNRRLREPILQRFLYQGAYRCTEAITCLERILDFKTVYSSRFYLVLRPSTQLIRAQIAHKKNSIIFYNFNFSPAAAAVLSCMTQELKRYKYTVWIWAVCTERARKHKTVATVQIMRSLESWMRPRLQTHPCVPSLPGN